MPDIRRYPLRLYLHDTLEENARAEHGAPCDKPCIQSIRLSYYHLASHHPARSDHKISLPICSDIDFKIAQSPRCLFSLAENTRQTRFIEERLAPLHDGLHASYKVLFASNITNRNSSADSKLLESQVH
jgi:hypothetical protein